MDISIISSVDFETLVDDFANQLSYEEMLEFIGLLDMIVADWDFTEMIYNWAREQHKEFLAETDDTIREVQYR